MLVKQRIKTNILWVVVATFVAVLLFSTTQVFAQASKNAPASGSVNVLKLSPVRSDISVVKGSTHVLQVTVSNVTKAPITVKAVANDFVAGDEENGTPALILEEGEYAPTHSLKRFMQPVGNVTIPAGQSKVVDVRITVPTTAQAGGYFGAIRFAPVSPNQDSQVNLSSSVASIILLTVPGPVTEKLDLTEFNVQQNGKSNWYFQSPNDLNLTWRFKSGSNIQLGPIGKISVKSGDKVVYEYDFNEKPQRDMVLPDSARRWTIPLKNIESFGHYTVYATFTYGSKNESVNVERSFWVIPAMVIIITVVAVLLVIALIIGIVMFLRRYKRNIINGQSRRGRR